MMRGFALLILLAGALAPVLPPARAQTIDYKQRTADLTALSALFGELHHIRRLCEPRRESEIWRERMKRMIELEQPTSNLQNELVKAFNDGYRTAQTRFDRCDRRAEDFAASNAARGEARIARLMAPLYEGADETTYGTWEPGQ